MTFEGVSIDDYQNPLIQKLETVGVSYSVSDVFQLLDAGWNVDYRDQTMKAFRVLDLDKYKELLAAEVKQRV